MFIQLIYYFTKIDGVIKAFKFEIPKPFAYFEASQKVFLKFFWLLRVKPVSHLIIYDFRILVVGEDLYSRIEVILCCRCVIGQILEISSRLERLSLGCCEDLCQFVPQILQSKYICPNNITLLGLASMKDDPGSYLIVDFEPTIFEQFTKLQVFKY